MVIYQDKTKKVLKYIDDCSIRYYSLVIGSKELPTIYGVNKMKDYTYNTMSFDTAAQALEVAIHDYVTACGNNSMTVAKDYLADLTMDDFNTDWPMCFDFDADDFDQAKELVAEVLGN